MEARADGIEFTSESRRLQQSDAVLASNGASESESNVKDVVECELGPSRRSDITARSDDGGVQIAIARMPEGGDDDVTLESDAFDRHYRLGQVRTRHCNVIEKPVPHRFERWNHHASRAQEQFTLLRVLGAMSNRRARSLAFLEHSIGFGDTGRSGKIALSNEHCDRICF